jgi:hypothetical protein
MIGIIVVVLAACLAYAIVIVLTAHSGLAVIAFLLVMLAGLAFGVPRDTWGRWR